MSIIAIMDIMVNERIREHRGVKDLPKLRIPQGQVSY